MRLAILAIIGLFAVLDSASAQCGAPHRRGMFGRRVAYTYSVQSMIVLSQGTTGGCSAQGGSCSTQVSACASSVASLPHAVQAKRLVCVNGICEYR